MLAEKHLTPPAAAAVRDLLGPEHLADVALWADDIKLEQRPETRPWHYVGIPDASPAFDDKRDCPGRACVVDKISDFAAVLRDRRATRTQRTEALKFLVHFVADLHQPLHCDNKRDHGGHDIAVRYPGLEGADFHVVWDTGVVQTDMGSRDLGDYVSNLDPQAIANWAAWRGGTPEDWANDAHRIAQRIYAELGDGPRPLNLTDEYGRKYASIVEGQLERAGVRLATTLNAALETSAGPSAEPSAGPAAARP